MKGEENDECEKHKANPWLLILLSGHTDDSGSIWEGEGERRSQSDELLIRRETFSLQHNWFRDQQEAIDTQSMSNSDGSGMSRTRRSLENDINFLCDDKCLPINPFM